MTVGPARLSVAALLAGRVISHVMVTLYVRQPVANVTHKEVFELPNVWAVPLQRFESDDSGLLLDVIKVEDAEDERRCQERDHSFDGLPGNGVDCMRNFH